ncbi:MAG: DUF4340 domain-containing protein [bacterium]
MSWKPTLWLLVLVVLTGLFIVVFEKNTDQGVRSLPLNSPLLHVSSEVITRLSITAGSNRVECVRREGEWFLTRPMEARADAARINRLVDTLVKIRKQEIIDPVRRAKRGLSLASFGLEPPRARLVLGTDSHSDEILLGEDAPLGNCVYLSLNDERDVIGATLSVSDILPLDPDGFRDQAVFPSSIKQAIRLEVKHAGGFFQLALKDGVWRIQQPFDARADGTRVERIWRILEALKIEGLVGGASLSDSVAYGLGVDEAALQVSVWTEGRRQPLVLTVGKALQDNPSRLYARISDMASLGVMSKEILSLQAIPASSLRDRRLCDADPSSLMFLTLSDDDSKVVMEKGASGAWMITEPLRFPANTRAVSALLKAVSGLQGEEMGNGITLKGLPPEVGTMSCRLKIANQIPVYTTTNETLSVAPATGEWTYRFSWPGAGTSTSQVFGEEAGAIYKVSSDDLSKMWRRLAAHPVFADPLAYMDCLMLDLNPQQVRRITLTREGREETVTSGLDGSWTVDSPPGGRVVEGAIPSLLTMAANLQAERIETLVTTNLASFKLNEAAIRVTFGLSGSSGIQKTVLIGDGDGRKGVYSMIQGQDVVFVLKKETTEAFVRPLVTSP